MTADAPAEVQRKVEAQAQARGDECRRRVYDELTRHGVGGQAAGSVAELARTLVVEQRMRMGAAGLGRPVRDSPQA